MSEFPKISNDSADLRLTASDISTIKDSLLALNSTTTIPYFDNISQTHFDEKTVLHRLFQLETALLETNNKISTLTTKLYDTNSALLKCIDILSRNTEPLNPTASVDTDPSVF